MDLEVKHVTALGMGVEPAELLLRHIPKDRIDAVQKRSTTWRRILYITFSDN